MPMRTGFATGDLGLHHTFSLESICITQPHSGPFLSASLFRGVCHYVGRTPDESWECAAIEYLHLACRGSRFGPLRVLLFMVKFAIVRCLPIPLL